MFSVLGAGVQGLAIAASCSSGNSFRLRRRLSLLVATLNRVMVLRVLLLAFLVLTFGAHLAVAATVGTVSKVENQAHIGSAAAVVGTPVQTNDELSTGPKSHLEVTFSDDTKLTLGENAKVVIDRYVFDPDKSVGELALSTSAAAFRLATGKISEMQDRKISVAAPFAALAVRGTDFWWGPINGHFGALLVSNSRVDVSGDRCRGDVTNLKDDVPNLKDDVADDHKRCRCRVTLDKPGEGTDIRHGECPGLPYMWPPGQVAAALSSTSFGLAAVAPGLGLGIPALAAAGVAGAAIGSAAGNTDNSKPPKVSDMINPPPSDGGNGNGEWEWRRRWRRRWRRWRRRLSA